MSKRHMVPLGKGEGTRKVAGNGVLQSRERSQKERKFLKSFAQGSPKYHRDSGGGCSHLGGL